MKAQRIYLSPPDMGVAEQQLVADAFESNWIAPTGPHVEAFEREVAHYVGAGHAVAVSSGSAALHLALIHLGVTTGDVVVVSDLTFSASVNPIRYQGAEPVLVDSEPRSWNLDPQLLTDAIAATRRSGKRIAAVVAVHLYGQACDIDAIGDICRAADIPLIEDAAEALGARYKGAAPGTFGLAGFLSFNGNKIITTSGGGMVITDDARFAEHTRKLSTQAREPAAHYEHTEIGYNYRLSNVLAAIGRGQLQGLEAKVCARRAIFDRYVAGLGGLPGLSFMPEETFGDPRSRSTRWLTCIQIDERQFGTSRERVRLALESENIESRPVWKPMHLQPVFAGHRIFGGAVSEQLFRDGLCLPSGSSLLPAQQDRVVDIVRRCCTAAPAGRR